MYLESYHSSAMKYKYNYIVKVNMIITGIFEIKESGDVMCISD